MDKEAQLSKVSDLQAMSKNSEFAALVRGQITEVLDEIIRRTPSGESAVVADGDIGRVVNTITAAMELAIGGAPVGTVCRNPADGHTATRVVENGLPCWRMSDGSRDDRANLEGWDTIYSPE